MDDRDLVARVRAGDFGAASTLLSRHQDAAFTVALRLMGQRADAEDIAQEALVRAYTRIAELSDPSSFEAWLRRIAVNLSLNALRRRGLLSFESISASDGEDREPQRVVDRRSTTEDAALTGALRDEIDLLLQELPVEQRVALILSDMYGYDIAEIADLQRCGLSAAKMRIRRGRDRFRKLLEKARVLSDESQGM